MQRQVANIEYCQDIWTSANRFGIATKEYLEGRMPKDKKKKKVTFTHELFHGDVKDVDEEDVESQASDNSRASEASQASQASQASSGHGSDKRASVRSSRSKDSSSGSDSDDASNNRKLKAPAKHRIIAKKGAGKKAPAKKLPSKQQYGKISTTRIVKRSKKIAVKTRAISNSKKNSKARVSPSKKSNTHELSLFQ